MKRSLQLLLSLLLSVQLVNAQTKIGIKFGPNLSMNRLDTEIDTAVHGLDGVGMRFMIGPIIDIRLTDNYYVSTGLIFNGKRTGMSYTSDSTGTIRNAPTMNYVSIPATMKLFTNEFDLDKKLYLQFGGQIDILTRQPPSRYDLIDRAWFMDLSLYIGAGMEYNISIDTRVFAGFSYSRGLINVVREHAFDQTGNYRIWNDIVSLELGVKF